MKHPRPSPRSASALLRLCAALAALAATALAAPGDNWNEWKPIDPAQLALKEPAVEKDADAEALFWEVRVADEAEYGTTRTVLTHYIRIKIFTERGRESQSRVEIPFGKVFGREFKVTDIAGRTIKPDGSVLELKKEDIFEQTKVKANGIKIKVKSFAMPGVEPGALIEYRWREVRGDNLSFYDRLEFARDIPVRQVKYYIKPISVPGLSGIVMRAQFFQGEMSPFQKEKNGFHSTQMTNVPAFREEPRMPPEYSVRPWMLLYYAEDKKLAPDKFWSEYGREVFDDSKSSMKVNDDIKRAAAEAVGDAQTPEEKLERIFGYVRAKVKNVYDDAAGFTVEQLKKMKANKTPADTLKRGVGDWRDIDLLFAALVTAAGFEARIAQVSDRSDFFFDPSFPDSYFLRYPQGRENIAVRVGDTWRFYDPGLAYTTRGMLSWQEEGQQALISDPKQPSFVITPVSPPEKSLERRTAKLKLSEDGTLEGDVRIEYTGHLAAERKEANDDDSPQEREETLRNKIKAQMPSAELSDVRVENVTDPDKPFVYAFKVRVPGYAQRTGKRLFLQPAFFQYGLSPLFPTSQRRHDIYFNFPWAEQDRVEVTLPEGFALDSPDAPVKFTMGELGNYEPRLQVTKDGRTIIYSRSFAFGRGKDGTGTVLLFPVNAYESLKSLFDQIHKQDSHTLSVKQAAPAAAQTSN